MDAPNAGEDGRAPTFEDLVEICRCLNQENVKYLLIGGFAVIALGGARTTKDIDFTTGLAGRPAELFRFRRDVLRERPQPGVGMPSLSTQYLELAKRLRSAGPNETGSADRRST